MFDSLVNIWLCPGTDTKIYGRLSFSGLLFAWWQINFVMIIWSYILYFTANSAQISNFQTGSDYTIIQEGVRIKNKLIWSI